MRFLNDLIDHRVVMTDDKRVWIYFAWMEFRQYENVKWVEIAKHLLMVKALRRMLECVKQ